ncbi:S26 family signal peptidase [Streptomyces sp. NPDC049040]|uniref:S26 family signal peptidase n=1 Tax=Streptomyces sp. NPDC049040 TaxID=3365593 RepID=UPI00371900DC
MTGAPAVLGAVALAAAAGVLGLLRLRRRFLVVTVHGESMLPAYRPGERVVVRRTPAGALRAGQVVVLRGDGPAPGRNTAGREAPGAAQGPRARWIIKRVTAVPGDPIPRDTVPALRSAPGTRVPAGRLVVLGDNPERSHDSRHAGYLAADRLYGVVLRKLGR